MKEGLTALGRLKVLLSAYACEPNRGSEPGIGWHTACELAKQHDTWVFTSAYHREHIEKELAVHPNPNLHFVYIDTLESFRPLIGEEGLLIQFHYYFWQVQAYRKAKELHETVGFDLAHHVSYVRCWTPSFMSRLPIPFVWGPIGGNEPAPVSFIQTLGPRGVLYEFSRKMALLYGKTDPFVRQTAKRSAHVYVTSPETGDYIRSLGAKSIEVLTPTAPPNDIVAMKPACVKGSDTQIRFMSIGRLIPWKGIHFALKALALSELKDAHYYIVGSGAEQQRLEQLAREYGVEKQISFHDISRQEMLELLKTTDVFLHPAIHEGGATVTVEAMAAAKPVICFDMGGNSFQVPDNAGMKIPVDELDSTLVRFADAMKTLASDPELRKEMGCNGRQWIMQRLTWEKRGEQYHRLYEHLDATHKVR